MSDNSEIFIDDWVAEMVSVTVCIENYFAGILILLGWSVGSQVRTIDAARGRHERI